MLAAESGGPLRIRSLTRRARPDRRARLEGLPQAEIGRVPCRVLRDGRDSDADVLGSKSESEHARRNAAQHRKSLQELERQRQLVHRGFMAQSGTNEALVRED